MGNVDAFVEHFFMRKGILGIPLAIWDQSVRQLSFLCLLIGSGGAFYARYLGNRPGEGTFLFCSGLFVSVFLLFISSIGDTEVMRREILTALKDELSNGKMHRIVKEPLRTREWGRKKEELPDPEEVKSLKEAAVTSEEKQILLEVLEEYFW